PAASARDLPVDRAGGNVLHEVLELGAVDPAVRKAQLDLVRHARLPAEDAEGGRLGRAAVAEDARLDGAALEREDGLDAEPAAPFARAGGVGQVLVAVQKERIDDL